MSSNNFQSGDQFLFYNKDGGNDVKFNTIPSLKIDQINGTDVMHTTDSSIDFLVSSNMTSLSVGGVISLNALTIDNDVS